MSLVSEFDGVDAKLVTPTSHFKKDLGLDSLDTVEIIVAVEDEFLIEIPDAEVDQIVSIPSIVQLVKSKKNAH